jgi:hypothetical protein
MTRESNSAQARELGITPDRQSVSAAPQTEYKVGPGCPPKEHQFRPGQSGNPKGAKRKVPSLAPDLRKLLEQALNQKVTVTQGDRKRTLTWFAAGIEQLVKQYVKGDRHGRRELFELAEKVGIDLLGIQKKALEEALTPNRQAILADYAEKQFEVIKQRPPVMAPPELLDDDSDDPNGR